MAKRPVGKAPLMGIEQRHPAAGIVTVIVAALAAVGFALAGQFSYRLFFPPTSRPAAESEPRVEAMSVAEAYELAWAEARAWHGDAMLSSLAAAADGAGRSDRWELVFVAASVKGRGYRVTVAEHSVVLKEEIAYQGVGAEFPSDLITPEEAVGQARAIKGYETAVVQGVEAVYGAGGKIWYWGVRTDRGVVSIKARRQ